MVHRTFSHGRWSRTPARRALLLGQGVVALLLPLAMLSPTAPVSAAAAGPSTPGGSIDEPPTTYADGPYVVLLREPAAVAYDGSRPGFARTRVSAPEQFSAARGSVRAWSTHLRAVQDAVAGSVDASATYHYTLAVNGFAALLDGQQAQALARDPRVLLVERDTGHDLTTWHTPTAIGLSGSHGGWADVGGYAKAGDGTVVGVLDTGIWPEASSFDGRALTTRPQTRWRISMTGSTVRMHRADGGWFTGECETGQEWTLDDCSTKVVGARYYPDAYLGLPPSARSADEFVSARDAMSHGTHVTATAAGNHGVPARIGSRAFGDVSGMAPAARIAMYKVCWDVTDPAVASCATGSVVAAVDDAVADGVDALNVSISGSRHSVLDAMEMAFEGAAEAGIFVAAGAGNDGTDASTVGHPGPWLTTVAATTHIAYENTLVLGDGSRVAGASLADHAVPRSPLVISGDGAGTTPAERCEPGTLDPGRVGGAIVVCVRGVVDRVAKSAEVARAGGVGMVLVNTEPGSLNADAHAVPTVHVSDQDAATVLGYAVTPGATARIAIGNLTSHPTPLPQVAAFSSRGPIQAAGGDVLKPDLGAPGVDVVAAVPAPGGDADLFGMDSGTSMAAPHVTGLGALLLAAHPGWSAQQVKSALVTSAGPVLTEGGTRSGDAFAQGSGLVNGHRALDPGLFVVSTPADWQRFLADQGLDNGQDPLAGTDLNLPSIADSQVAGSTTVRRTFLAARAGRWRVSAQVPGFGTTVRPSTVRAARAGARVTVQLTFTRTSAALGSWSQGVVTLAGPTSLRLPVALRPVAASLPAELRATGTSGDEPVVVQGGVDRTVQVSFAGLAEPWMFFPVLTAGTGHYRCMPAEDITQALRADLSASDPTANLDLYVYKATRCDLGTITQMVAKSENTGTNERVALLHPEPGWYIVEAWARSTGSSTSVTANLGLSFLYPPEGAAEDLVVTPDQLQLRTGEPATLHIGWSNLPEGELRYGLVEVEGAPTPLWVKILS